MKLFRKKELEDLASRKIPNYEPIQNDLKKSCNKKSCKCGCKNGKRKRNRMQ